MTRGNEQPASADPSKDRMGRRVTIRDVAELAKVSLGTVSNVMNKPSLVAPSTRERVLEAIGATGFIRSTAAHQLRGGRSRSIGVVIPDAANPFFTEMVRGAEGVLLEAGYVLFLCSTDESLPREALYLHLLEEQRVDGLLITPVGRDLSPITALVERGIPAVLLNHADPSGSLCSVTVDGVRGGELAVTHLFEQGHRPVAFVNGPLSIRQCAERRSGARRVARRLRLEESLVHLTVPALTVECGEAVVAELLELTPRPRGVMCANDLLALGVLRGLAARSIEIPGEVAVAGYDDVTFAAALAPALTSVRQPKLELGLTAAQLILEEIRSGAHTHREVRFEPELVVRASSGPSGDALSAHRDAERVIG
ncbi:MAG: LacI family DNA-binding transcriptional regulator [Acidimicrobiales bacterium]